MRFKSGWALAVILALVLPIRSNGQQIVQYNFANADATGVTLATMETPTSTAANSAAGNLSLGTKTDTALNEGAAASAFWASPGPDYVSVARDPTAGATDDTNFYVDFTATAATGFVLDPTGLTLVGGQGGGTANTRTYYLFDSNDGLPSGANTVTGTGSGNPAPPFATVNSGTLVGEGAFSVVRNTAAVMNSPTIPFPAGDQNLYSFEVRVYFDTPTVSQNIDLASITLNGSVVTAPLQERWVSSSSGDYNQRTNWSSGTPPNAVDAEADFLGAISTNQVVFTTTPITLGKMVFNNGASYALTGAFGANLTLQTSSGNATVDVQAGTHEINLPLTLASNTTFQTDAAGASMVIADPMTINPGISLTTTGSGSVTYESTITLLSGATMNIASSTYAHALSINSSAVASLAPSTSAKTLLQLDTLSLAATSGVPTGKLDLANNDMILHNTDANTLFNDLKTGFNAHAGYWNGAGGIISSAAAADPRHLTTLGYRQSNGSAFDGVSTTSADTIVKYTYYGDADLNGVVNGADYQQIDKGFGMHLSGWVDGDFNYDGVINGLDYALIDNTFNQITATGAGPLALASDRANLIAEPSSADVRASQSVPEPVGFTFVCLGVAGLLKRRRGIH